MHPCTCHKAHAPVPMDCRCGALAAPPCTPSLVALSRQLRRGHDDVLHLCTDVLRLIPGRTALLVSRAADHHCGARWRQACHHRANHSGGHANGNGRRDRVDIPSASPIRRRRRAGRMRPGSRWWYGRMRLRPRRMWPRSGRRARRMWPRSRARLRMRSRLAAMKLFPAPIEAGPRDLSACEIAAHRMNAGARDATERKGRGRGQHHRRHEARGDGSPCVIRLRHSVSA